MRILCLGYFIMIGVRMYYLEFGEQLQKGSRGGSKLEAMERGKRVNGWISQHINERMRAVRQGILDSVLG